MWRKSSVKEVTSKVISRKLISYHREVPAGVIFIAVLCDAIELTTGQLEIVDTCEELDPSRLLGDERVNKAWLCANPCVHESVLPRISRIIFASMRWNLKSILSGRKLILHSTWRLNYSSSFVLYCSLLQFNSSWSFEIFLPVSSFNAELVISW